MLVERQNENGTPPASGEAASSGTNGNSGNGGGGRSLAFYQEALRSTLLEAATSAELYQKILDDGGNKKERNQLKRRVATAEKRKLKLMRKVANMEQGGSNDQNECGDDADNGKAMDDAELDGQGDDVDTAETNAKRPRVDEGVAS